MQKLLKNRNFMLLWCGQTISGLGTWINFVGLNLYIYSIFGSGKILGLFMVARMLPALLFGPLGGYLADRYSRRTIMIICDSLRAVLVLGFLLTKDIYSFFILGFVLSALDKIFMAANSSIVPNIVESEDILHANSITRMSHSVITVLGPAAGGLLIAMFTYKIVFIIDSITFIISVITAFLIKYSQKSAGIKKKGSLFTDFKETFAFFAAKSTLFYLVIVRFIDAFGSGAYNTSLPIFSKLFTTINISLPMFVKSFDLSRSAAYGWLVGAWALGEFSGSFAVGKLMKSFKISSEKMFSF